MTAQLGVVEDKLQEADRNARSFDNAIAQVKKEAARDRAQLVKEGARAFDKKRNAETKRSNGSQTRTREEDTPGGNDGKG